MADDTTTGTGTTAPSTASEPQVPAGQRLVSESEWAALQGQVEGFRQAGFENPDQLKPWAQVLADASKSQMNPEQIRALLSGNAGSQPNQGQEPKGQNAQTGDATDKPLTVKDFNNLLQAQEAKWTHARAYDAHNSAILSQAGEVSKKVAEAIGDSLPAEIKDYLVDGIMSKYDAERMKSQYPVGHPLHGQHFPPLSPDRLNQLMASVTGAKEKLSAHRLSTIAKAGNSARSNGTPYTPAASGQTNQRPMSPAEQRKAELVALAEANGIRTSPIGS